MHSWADAGKPVRLLEKEARKDDPDPKALSCYGLYLPELKETWLRFVDGRPVSSITTQFLSWCCHNLQQRGKEALLLIWDNASWHKSHEVRGWISAHNRCVKASGHGVRIVPCLLPTKSPWLNAIEPQWIHGKRKVAEPERLLGAYELAERVSKSSAVITKSIYPFPRRSPECALGAHRTGALLVPVLSLVLALVHRCALSPTVPLRSRL